MKHYVTGEDTLISLAGPANKQGRIIADNVCGGDSRYKGSQGSAVIKVFDMTAAATGINETNARNTGLDADTVILSPMSHAGYYPGGKVMTVKVVFEKKTYRLLGAQIVGYDGVDKRIDVLATAIHAGMKATQLRDRLSEIEKGKPVYVICQSGLRSYIACRILEGNGFEAYNFSGGFRFYDAVVNDRMLIERAYSCGMDK